MAPRSERRQYRSDTQLRQQRKELERQWNAQQRRDKDQRERDNAVERTARIDRLLREYRTPTSAPIQDSSPSPRRRRER
jgi:hypothetical protein